jgi:hypothetical protein
VDHDRHSRYVDQLEAHMDEGGGTAPNNVRDLIQMVRELVSGIVALEADLYDERKKMVAPTCFQCGGKIEREQYVFRCTDCEMPFHRECAQSHFDNRPRMRAASSTVTKGQR